MSNPDPSPTVTPDSLTASLRAALNITHTEIQDISGGCGQSFSAIIVSPDFQGKTALQRHRLVNKALKEEISLIHAWTPRCLSVEQWEKEKGQEG